MNARNSCICCNGYLSDGRPNTTRGRDGKCPKKVVAAGPAGKTGPIRRAAFQKPGPILISMNIQRNFDLMAGFCQSALSDRFRKAPIRSHTADLVSGAPGTSED